MKLPILEDLLNLFFPDTCVVCRKVLLKPEKQICLHCLTHIPRTNFHLILDNPVEKKFWGKVGIERGSSFFFFQKGTGFQQIVHELKYRANQDIGILMGKHAAIDLLSTAYFADVDYLIPVPLHPYKLRKRGYNQSELIARGIASVLQIPVHTDSLIRTSSNSTQTRKNIFERYENTTGIFAGTNTKILEGKHILLVDDVLTTGSTLEACIRALSNVQGIKISVFTLAIA